MLINEAVLPELRTEHKQNDCQASSRYKLISESDDFQKWTQINFPLSYIQFWYCSFQLSFPECVEERKERGGKWSNFGRVVTELEPSIHSRLIHFSGSLRPSSVHLPPLSANLSLPLLHYQRDVQDVLLPVSQPVPVSAGARSNKCGLSGIRRVKWRW